MEYMSQECYDKLVAELRHLITVELPKAQDELSEARDKGDLSENFEYHAARRAHGRLLGKIRYKQNILANARVLDTAQRSCDTVQLLCTVGVVNLKNNRSASYTITSPHEANIHEGKISMKSPIGQALMNHKTGDVVEVKAPAGVIKLRIESIGL
jgi:transcription elongation factor GreA